MGLVYVFIPPYLIPLLHSTLRKMATSGSEDAAATAAPSNYTTMTDSATGGKYFLDHKTQESTWVNPAGEFYTPGLPFPWERLVDKNGRTYYTNHETKTTSWEDPTATKLASNKPFTTDLPFPWERQFDVQGRAFYLNLKTKQTSWLDPVKKERLEKEGKQEDDLILKEVTPEGTEYFVNYMTGNLC